MSKLPVSYQAIEFKQLFIPSFGMCIVASAIWYFSGFHLPWFGSLDFASIALCMIAVVVAYAAIYGITCHAWLNTVEMRQLNRKLTGMFQNLSWPQLIILSISAGVGEELLFRGLLQTWLIANLNPLWGILGASLVFGLMHYLNATYIILTFVLGCLFGIAYHMTNSLLMVMAAHTLYDIIAFGVIVKFPYLLNSEPRSGGFDA